MYPLYTQSVVLIYWKYESDSLLELKIVKDFYSSFSQTFLFHHPFLTLDTSFSSPKPDKANTMDSIK